MNRKQRRINRSKVQQKLKVKYSDFTDLKFGSLPQTSHSVDKCYAKGLGSCGGEISREHYISESILEMFSGIQPEGIPWMSHRSQLIGPNDLTVKCLCEKHNNYLSPLDVTASAFFKSILDYGTYNPKIVTVSGDLLERWCLKLLFGFLATKQVKIKNETIGPEYLGDDLLEYLFLGTKKPLGRGLYSYLVQGQQIQITTKIGLETLLIDDVFQGLRMNLAGFEFYFVLCDKEVGFKTDHPSYDYVLHHPAEFNKDPYPQAIKLKWD